MKVRHRWLPLSNLVWTFCVCYKSHELAIAVLLTGIVSGWRVKLAEDDAGLFVDEVGITQATLNLIPTLTHRGRRHLQRVPRHNAALSMRGTL